MPRTPGNGRASGLVMSASRAQITISRHQEPEPQPPQRGPLEGWLKKKHSGSSLMSKKWGKRWVHVNEERGRLHIGRKPGKDGTTVVSARTRLPRRG